MSASGIPFLTSVDAKLSMAEEHLQKLESAFKVIGDANSYSITFQHNADSTQVATWIKFNPPPGVRWAAIIGNCASDLRSALDHIIYAIAVGESGTDPPPDHRRLMFPIADTNREWKKVRDRIRTLSGPVRAVVQNQQPYIRRQANNPLSVLGAINDQDKHRSILVGASLMKEAECKFPGPIQPSGLVEVLARNIPVIDKAPLIIFRFSKPNPDVAVDFSFSFGVVLNVDGVWRPALSELRRVRDEVVRIVDLLRPFVK
jgi:hypothetical protein